MIKKAILSLVSIALVLTAAPSFAFDANDKVTAAPNSKGDLFFTPYIALPGIQTKLTVTNTSQEYSTVVKVVVHSKVFSTELLDFFLYLSPADVWTGYLVNEGGDVKVQSTDDSIATSITADGTSAVFASVENPVDKAVFTDELCTNDTASFGYIEAVQATSFRVDDDNAPGWSGNELSRPISKGEVFSEYEVEIEDIGAGTEDQSYNEPRNIVTSVTEYQIPSLGVASLNRAWVFADWDNTEFLTRSIISGIKGNSARNTLGELEAAMAKMKPAMNFVNSDSDLSLHMFNFPTKLANKTSDCVYDGPGGTASVSPFWEETNDQQCLPFSVNRFNLSEELPAEDPDDPFSGGGQEEGREMCDELDFFFDFPVTFEEGWVEYTFEPVKGNETEFVTESGQTGRYTGIPVLPEIINFGSTGFSTANAAWDDGTVDYDVIN